MDSVSRAARQQAKAIQETKDYLVSLASLSPLPPFLSLYLSLSLSTSLSLTHTRIGLEDWRIGGSGVKDQGSGCRVEGWARCREG
eukprot:3927172-Rhodomonas_salina.1